MRPTGSSWAQGSHLRLQPALLCVDTMAHVQVQELRISYLFSTPAGLGLLEKKEDIFGLFSWSLSFSFLAVFGGILCSLALLPPPVRMRTSHALFEGWCAFIREANYNKFCAVLCQL